MNEIHASLFQALFETFSLVVNVAFVPRIIYSKNERLNRRDRYDLMQAISFECKYNLNGWRC
jgi:hypothetical protein